MQTPALRFPQKTYYGWWVLLATMAIGGLGGGSYLYGFTVFFLPLSADLGLSRAVTSLVFSASRMEGGLYGALVGWLIDRYGTRRLLMLGGLLAGVGFVLLSRVDSLLFFALVYLCVLSFGINGGVTPCTSATVNQWFVRRKATAMGGLSASFALGGAVLVPVLGLGVHYYGWRTTAMVLGIVLAIAIPALALVVRRSPESMGLLPDGETAASAPGKHTPVASEFTAREALRTNSFRFLTAAVTLRFLGQSAVVVHLVPLMVDKGVEETTAAGITGMLAMLSIPTRLMLGWLGDRFTKRYLVATSMLLEVCALSILLSATDDWQLYAFVLVFALGYGGGALDWSMLGEYFGRKSFATLRGLMGLVYSWGNLAGPVFAGWIYDTTHSYQIAIATFAVLYFCGAVLYMFCRRPAASPAGLVAVVS